MWLLDTGAVLKELYKRISSNNEIAKRIFDLFGILKKYIAQRIFLESYIRAHWNLH